MSFKLFELAKGKSERVLEWHQYRKVLRRRKKILSNARKEKTQMF